MWESVTSLRTGSCQLWRLLVVIHLISTTDCSTKTGSCHDANFSVAGEGRRYIMPTFSLLVKFLTTTYRRWHGDHKVGIMTTLGFHCLGTIKLLALLRAEVVCSSSQLAPRIGLYTASLVSLTDVLIGWCASDCDAPTHIVTYPNKHGEYPPSPTWRASPTWRKQKAFPLPVEKAGNSLLFFRGRGQSYARRHGTWNSLVQRVIMQKWFSWHLITMEAAIYRPQLANDVCLF